MTNTIASDDAERAERLDFASYDAKRALFEDFFEIFERFDKEQLEAFTAAYRKISNALPDGTRQFYKRSGDGGRAAAMMQLGAVIDFIEALLGDGTLTLPLQALLWTLKDLDAGIVGPMAKEKPICRNDHAVFDGHQRGQKKKACGRGCSQNPGSSRYDH